MDVIERREHGRLRSVLAPLGAAAAVGAGATYLALVDPHEPGHYPPCPLYFLTGVYCPGCGGLRAVHDLAHADVIGALGMNPLFVACVPLLVLWWGRWTVRSWQGRPMRAGPARPAYAWGFAGVVMIFWVVRNLPFGRFLAP
jgi:hypothetical protein